MESLVSNLLSRYERGSLSRRDLIRGMAMLAAAGASTTAPADASQAAPAAKGFQTMYLEHASVTTADPQKSANWWKDALNLHQHPDQGDGAVRLGQEGKRRTLIVFRKGPVTGIVDHFAVAVEPFDRAILTADFKRRGIPTTAEGEFIITDPNGINCQLMDDRSKR